MDEDDEDDENGHSDWLFEILGLAGKILTNVSCKSVACFLLMLQRKGFILTLRCVSFFISQASAPQILALTMVCVRRKAKESSNVTVPNLTRERNAREV